MKLNALSAVVAGAVLASQAHAQVLYQDEQNTLELGGVLVLDAHNQFYHDDTQLSLNRSILNLAAHRQMGDNWVLSGKFEWDQFSNSPNSSSSNFRNRLAFVEASHEELGRLSFGKQWSAYHDVARYMDNMILIDPDATPIYSEGTDGAFAATGRGDNLMAYRMSVADFNIAAHYGFAADGYTGDISRKNNYGASLSYDSQFGLSLGVAYVENKVRVSGSDNQGLIDGDKQRALTFAGEYQLAGLRVAGAYTMGDKIHQADLYNFGHGEWADADAWDIWVEYNMSNGLRPFFYYSSIDFDDTRVNAHGNRDIVAGGLSYAIANGLIASIELNRYNLNDLGAGKREESGGGINLIYAF